MDQRSRTDLNGWSFGIKASRCGVLNEFPQFSALNWRKLRREWNVGTVPGETTVIRIRESHSLK